MNHVITLNTMNSFTIHEILEYVTYHLLKQNKKSVDFDGSCRYRSDDGSKCAVGACMSDREYNQKFEGVTITSSSFLTFGIEHSRRNLLMCLQRIHDHRAVFTWEDEILKLAQTTELKSYVDFDRLRSVIDQAKADREVVQ